MIFLLRYWKHALTLFTALAVVILFGLWRLEVAETKNLKTEIQALEDWVEEYQAEITQCNQDKVLSEKVSNDYQKSARSLRNQLNSLRNNPHCVPVEPSDPASRDNGAAAGTKLSETNGIRAGYLLDFAGNAEETRLKLIGCQAFVNNLYESRNQ